VHWQVHRLKASISSCRNGIWGNEAQGDESDIPCVRVADFDRNKLRVELADPTVRNVTEKERVGRLLLRGDLLLEKSGGGENQPVGCVVLYGDDTPAVCSNFAARVALADGQVSSYWRYVHAAAYAIRLTVGSINQTSGIQNLDHDRYFNECAPYPPRAEQATIAAFLDRETAKIDALVEEQKRLIELLKEKRQAVISQAVTKGLDPNVPMKDSGVEWLGEVPAHWEVRRVNSLSTKITNGYVGPTRDILVDEGIRYLQSLHIKGNRIRFDDNYFVTEQWSNEHTKSILETGDLLIVQTGDIGQAAVVTDEFAGCNCHALIIVSPLRQVVTGEYLGWVFNSDYGRNSLLAIQTGALHPHLNCGNVKDVLVPVPSMSEQAQIVRHCAMATTAMDDLTSTAEAAVSLLTERRAALISAAVTGKIDVRGLGPRPHGEELPSAHDESHDLQCE
jgi:type I restriction enzyme S subunit